MYQTCSSRATISQKSTYLIRHYAISSFGWTYLYLISHSWYEGYKNSNSKSIKTPKFSISSFKYTLQGLERANDVGKALFTKEK